MEEDDPAVDHQVGRVRPVAVTAQKRGDLAHCHQEGGQEDQLDDGQIDMPTGGLGVGLAPPLLAPPQQEGDRARHDQTGQGSGDLAGGPTDEAVRGETRPYQGGQREPRGADGQSEDEVGDEIEPAVLVLLATTPNRSNPKGDQRPDDYQEDETGQSDCHASSSHVWS